MARSGDNGIARLAERFQTGGKAFAADRLNMFCAAFSGTHRRARFQQRGVVHQQTFHAEMRAAAHNAAQVVRVADIFQRQHAIFFTGLAQPLADRHAHAFFDNKADAAVVFGAGGLRQLGILNDVIGFAVRRQPAQRFAETRRYALHEPGAHDRFGAALEQRLTGVLAVDARLFLTLTTDHFRIDSDFAALLRLFLFYRRALARRTRNGAPGREGFVAARTATAFIAARTTAAFITARTTAAFITARTTAAFIAARLAAAALFAAAAWARRTTRIFLTGWAATPFTGTRIRRA